PGLRDRSGSRHQRSGQPGWRNAGLGGDDRSCNTGCTRRLRGPAEPLGYLQMKRVRAACSVALTVLSVVLAGCGSGKDKSASDVPEVGVIVVQPQRVTITTLLPGRTVAFRIAQVRPQVSGIIKQRLFTEGALVQAAQPLYQLDPAPYQAAYDSAQAAVTKAAANL